ncbi:MAG: hypothetical protein II922_04250, partial [Succinimonas sp.]|nr:hypothetical protein [Succinimonas sp.]
AMIFGKKKNTAVQQHRDLLKLWNAGETEDGVFVLLGLEPQSTIHYGMTVRNMLYDALSYATQISNLSSLREQEAKNADNNNGEAGKNNNANLTSGKRIAKIRSSEEFLSGMKKDDKLKPVITLVLNLSGKPWKAPRNLYNILDIKNKRLLKYVNNYHLNIVSPAEIKDDDFAKFSTSLGFALKVVKYQNDDKIAEVIEERESTDSDTASFITAYTHFEFMYEKNSKEVNIMNGIERWGQKMMVLAVIDTLKNQGNSDEVIVDYVTKQFQVTPDYVRDLMKEWPNPLLEKVKARAPSVPAGA